MCDVEARDGHTDDGESCSFCRVCLESEHTETNPLFSPCRCSGTGRYVHRRCLHMWRTGLSRTARARQRCDLCLALYKTNQNGNMKRLSRKDHLLADAVNGMYDGLVVVIITGSRSVLGVSGHGVQRVDPGVLDCHVHFAMEVCRVLHLHSCRALAVRRRVNDPLHDISDEIMDFAEAVE